VDGQVSQQGSLYFVFVFLFYDVFVTVAIGNPERHMRKALHCGSKQQ